MTSLANELESQIRSLEEELEYLKSKRCETCEGTGKVEVLDHSRINSTTIDPPTKEVDCEACHARGIK